MNITLRTHIDTKRLQTALEAFEERRLPWIATISLTTLAKSVREELRHRVKTTYDRPVAYTVNAMQMMAAKFPGYGVFRRVESAVYIAGEVRGTALHSGFSYLSKTVHGAGPTDTLPNPGKEWLFIPRKIMQDKMGNIPWRRAAKSPHRLMMGRKAQNLPGGRRIVFLADERRDGREPGLGKRKPGIWLFQNVPADKSTTGLLKTGTVKKLERQGVKMRSMPIQWLYIAKRITPHRKMFDFAGIVMNVANRGWAFIVQPLFQETLERMQQKHMQFMQVEYEQRLNVGSE